MKLKSKILSISLLMLFGILAQAQIANAKTETVKISGNCGMCKENIETAGNVKNEANVVWNKDKKTAIITYDVKKTSKAEILKRIALAGYDNQSYAASGEAYRKLEMCCQYDRPNAKSK